MNKPILFAVPIAIASVVGFIFGVFFEGYHSKTLITDTIAQHNEVSTLLGWYEAAFADTLVLDDLAEIKSINDITSMKSKYQKNGASHVRLFRQKAEYMKKHGAKHSALVQLEAAISEMEKKYELQTP